MSAFMQGPTRPVYRRNRIVLDHLTPNPTLAGMSPTIQVYGTNFNGACVVYYDGDPQATTFLNEGCITADIAVGASGAHEVSVRDPDTGRVSEPIILAVT